MICAELTAHATAEEEIFYPAARKVLDEVDLLDEAEVEHALGEKMAARKKSLLAEYKANGLPVATTRSFTGHELKRGEPLEEAASAQ